MCYYFVINILSSINSDGMKTIMMQVNIVWNALDSDNALISEYALISLTVL